MWQLSLFVLELNVNTPVEASKHLGPGGERGAALCEITVLPLCISPRRFSETPLLFFLACSWEWGKGSFAERRDVFTEKKKKKKP